MSTTDLEPASGPNPSPSPSGGGDVENVLRTSASTDYEGQTQNSEGSPNASAEGTHISPSRQSQRSKPVVSPPEDEQRRAPGSSMQMHQGGYDGPSDSPYAQPPGGYYQGPGASSQFPPSGYQYPARPHKGPGHPAEDAERDRYAVPPPYYPPYPYGYDSRGYEGEGYVKRQRNNEDAVKNEPGREEESGRYPPGPNRPPYYDHRGPPPPGGGYNYHYYRPSVSESFDTGSEGGSKRASPRRSGPPPVTKAPSYPPPPSPNRYGPGADSSAASYPGARRSQAAGSDYSYNNSAIYTQSPRPPQHGAPPAYGSSFPPPRYEEGPGPSGRPPPPHDYYRDPRAPVYPGPPPPGYYEGAGPPLEGADPYRMGHPPGGSDEGHPLLHDDKMSTPRRGKMDRSPGSPKEGGSPNKPRPSLTAQAAIAAGMTEPPSAKEVDFDINNPPTQPVIPPSSRPVCTQNSEINLHDVLCGRGGGTNTQSGNRRFRTLVQEFQPTYLLCRRKEKPLIARTIVLIIRNRGGRFLKKHEDEGTYFEVGDDKAEAKTSQALREGLDVRASRSSMDGKKKPSRSRKKKNVKKSPDRRIGEDGASIGDSRRDGPPAPPHDGYAYPPPPPYGYYGYDPYYPPAYGAGYGPGPGPGPNPYGTPSRKRPRGPPPESPYEYPGYPPASPYKGAGYPYHYPEHYQSRGPGPAPEGGREEENPMWEMDFSPPRTMGKRQPDIEH